MNEREKEAFRICYEFYLKIRENPIKTQAGWDDFAKEVGDICEKLDISHNPLGWHLINAILETIGDLYKDGKIPLPDNYATPFAGKQTEMEV